MATSEEKQETIDTLKGPRYYRITLSGYGGESAYINISKAAYEFWSNIVEEYGDTDLVTYMADAQDAEGEHFDFENIDSVPKEADFMTDGEHYHSWYEAPGEYCHQYGVEFGSAYITVEEVDSGEYNSTVIADVIDAQDVEELCSTIEEDSDWEIEPRDQGECDTFEPEGEYVVQFYSSEKGGFFDGIVETVGEFDPRKLTFVINEYPNGEDIIDSIQYDGVDIANNGGDTNGKGYSAHVWSNV